MPFTLEAEDRIAATVRAYEQSPRNPVDTRYKPSGYGMVPAKTAVSTTAISAATSSKYGSGSAKLQVVKSDGTYSLMSPAITITVLNIVGASIPSGSQLILNYIDGLWFATVAPCPTSSS